MEVAEIKSKIDEIGKAWTEYKATNDQRLKEIEKNGIADPLLKEKLAKMDDVMSKNEELKGRLEKLEVALKRTGTGRPAGGLRIKDIDGNEIDAPEDWADVKSKYGKFLRKGANSQEVDGGRVFEHDVKSLSVVSDPDGGFTVTADLSGRVIKRVFETSPVEQVAAVQTIGTDALEGTYDDDESAAAWASERGARPETGTPKIGKWRIPVHELYAMPTATQRLLDDSNVNIEQWLSMKVADKFARTLNRAYVLGTGIGQPRGFLTYPAGTTLRTTIEQIHSGNATAFTDNGLMDMVYGLKGQYRTRAQWAFSRTSIGQIRKIKDLYGHYQWQPGLEMGQPNRLLGYAVNEFNDMPDPGADSLAGAFADWAEFYQIVKRAGVRVLRDPYTVKGFVLFYTTIRAGGDVLNTEAGKIQKLAV